MTTEPEVKKRAGRKKKVETTAAVVETSTTCTCNCEDQIELLTASCKNLEERVMTLTQYVRTFNTFLNSSMISNVVDGAAEEGLTEVLDTLTDVPNPING